MPYEAAKAVSATFCWSIRYALTPLFGKDFPSMCIRPGNSQFGKMIVDPEIVRRSTETAYQYRKQELELKMKAQQQRTQHEGQPVAMQVSSFRRDGFSNSTTAVYASSKGEDYSFSPTTTTAVSGNAWTPINPLATERTRPVRRSEKRTMTTGMLLPIEDMFHTRTKGPHTSQANPLKRRLNENNTENASASLSSAASGKPRGEARQTRKSYSYDESLDEDEEVDSDDLDDDDDINLDLSTDDDDSSSSDSDADLDLISDLSMLTSSDSEAGETDVSERRRRRCRHHGHSKPRQRKKSQQGMKHDSTLSSTTSSPPVPIQPSLSKQNHHPRDREAAETLLTLSSRSGSSSVEDRTVDSMKQTANRRDQVGQKEMMDGEAAAVFKEHTIKRLRRASF